MMLTQTLRLCVWIAFTSIANLCTPTASFLSSIDIHSPKSAIVVLRLAAADDDGSSYKHRWKHDPFDFSSKFGWDNFYKNGLDQTDTVGASDLGDDADPMLESLEYEWHPHIPHSAIVDAIKPAIWVASQYYSQKDSTQRSNTIPSILLVGCGNSALPRVLHDAFDTPVHVTCLDYSPVCIDMIKSMYEPVCPNMDFVVCDATKLQGVLWDEDTDKQSAGKKQFDIIVDKGLLDALMCGEGFDLERLMEGINDVLTPHDWGMHVLICFQLSKASKQSLIKLGSEGNNLPSLDWDFDIPVEGSEKGRACFNLARRCRADGTTGSGIEQMTTQWT